MILIEAGLQREQVQVLVVRRKRAEILAAASLSSRLCGYAELLENGAPDRIRTCDLWNRNPTLYPAELRVLTLDPEVTRVPVRWLVLNVLCSGHQSHFCKTRSALVIVFLSSGVKKIAISGLRLGSGRHAEVIW